MKILNKIFLIALLAVLANCTSDKQEKTVKQGIVKSNWGKVDDKEVYLYTLTNKNGTEVKISNYGGIVTSWITPDKNGNKSSIVLGFDDLKSYLTPPPYFGALIGRYGNRIAKGKFMIGDSSYTLETNNGTNHLHGGSKGFDKVVWNSSEVNDSLPILLLSYLSKDGEQGYPGNLKINVRYTLTNDDELQVEYEAETDKTTIINLTQHSYFNLTGDHNSNTILNHKLMVAADYYTPVDSSLIPTGELKSVKGTPFDFNTPEKIGKRIGDVPGGYDHNFVLNRKDSSLQSVAILSDSVSGRKLEVFTTEPGLQFYSGNFLDGTLKDSNGKPFNKYAGLCLESQHFPDSPNRPEFPSTLLKPGEKYHTVTKYKISLDTK
jgi:aldose 1-epimerase